MPQPHRRIFRPVLVLLLMSLIVFALVAARTLALAGLAAQQRTPLFETAQAAQSPPVTLRTGAATDARVSSDFIAAPPALPTANAHHDVQREELSAVQIALQPHGFEPAQLSRQRAPFLLILRNRSGLDETILQVASSQGARLREVRLPHNRTKWSVRLDLPSGDYSLAEANHPNWIFRLSIR